MSKQKAAAAAKELPPRRRNQQAATSDKMRAIERAAADLFAEAGFSGVSMRDIATAAGVQLGTLSYFYQDKQDLYDRVLKTTLSEFEHVLLEAASHGETALEKINSFIAALVRAHAERTAYGQIVARETVDGPHSRMVALGRQTFLNLRTAVNPLISELRGGAVGDEAADRLTGSLITMVYAAARGESMYAAALGIKERDLADQIEQLQSLALNGLLECRPVAGA